MLIYAHLINVNFLVITRKEKVLFIINIYNKQKKQVEFINIYLRTKKKKININFFK